MLAKRENGASVRWPNDIGGGGHDGEPTQTKTVLDRFTELKIQKIVSKFDTVTVVPSIAQRSN